MEVGNLENRLLPLGVLEKLVEESSPHDSHRFFRR
jgi:hypothetical protein